MEAGLHFTAKQVGEGVGIQVDAGGELTGLTWAHVQVDVEAAVAATAQLAIVLVSAFCRAGNSYVDVAQVAGSMVGDAHEELAMGHLAGVNVSHSQVGAELPTGGFPRAARFATATRAFEEFAVEIVATVGVMETYIELATHLIFEDTRVQVEASSKSLGLAGVQVEGDAKIALLAGAFLAVVDIHAVVTAHHIDVHIVHGARAVVGDADEELAMGLVAGVDIGHSCIGGKATCRGCGNRAK